ncbi:two-component system sensor histidine kinase ZraS [Kluyvera genomosp. 1]|uniref:two-component system sensor histidine kinase ZraS n=1 Tax=Kluyvera genomosp. 1 TaxID=2774053 RepID=UPI00068C94D3|nr:two-component system sensor histidine kinase ZraS [Kluyvera genomosp. 1]
MALLRLQKDSLATGISWLLTGVVLLLMCLFSALIVRDHLRESASAQQTIEEKGSVLIRALESGARVGMGMRMHHTQLQNMLEEMAWQPGVLWFAVTDEQGKIIAHSDAQKVGQPLYDAGTMQALAAGDKERWRRMTSPEPTLEIYRQFRPLTAPGSHHIRMMMRRNQVDTPQVIFIAFDARELEAEQSRSLRNMIVMLCAAAVVMVATVLAQFWFSRYQRSRKLLQEATHRKEKLVALGHLAAGVAHEIRNPLSSIKGLAKYFAERTPPGGEAYELAQVMSKEADRLNRVVSELLELVRPAHLKWQSVDLNEVISHSLQLVSQDALSRKITLHFTAHPEGCRIQADPDRLNQVLLNLYLNAIQAIGHEGAISVSVAECGDGRIRLSVADSGKGMTTEQLQAIFTPYFTTKADGTGLGLAVVQNIVEQHGGTIHVDSSPCKGSVFTLYLPVNGQQKDEQG